MFQHESKTINKDSRCCSTCCAITNIKVRKWRNAKWDKKTLTGYCFKKQILVFVDTMPSCYMNKSTFKRFQKREEMKRILLKDW